MRFAVISLSFTLMSVPFGFATASENPDSASSYDDLLMLFADWREFESPPLLDGAPDYTAEQFTARRDDFLELRERLDVARLVDHLAGGVPLLVHLLADVGELAAELQRRLDACRGKPVAEAAPRILGCNRHGGAFHADRLPA